MTRDKVMLQTEVRHAVRDYLDSLISQRSGAGKGMAVSANDVLVAAKTAGQQATKQEANTLLEGIGQTGMRVVRDNQPDKRVSRSKSVPLDTKPKPTGPAKHRSQYHWLVWKTTPTPTPVTPVPLDAATPVPMAEPVPIPVPAPVPVVKFAPVISAPAPLPVPVPPAQPRPSSVASTTLNFDIFPTKLDLPSPSPKPIALNSPTPEPFKTPVFDMANIGPPNAVEIVTPEPIPVVYKQAPTPDEMKPDHRDILSSPQVMPADIRNAIADKKTYEPAIQAWVSNANDYDRKVAYGFFKAMNGGRSISSAASRPGATSRISIDDPVNKPDMPATPAARTASSMTAAGVRTSVPMFSQKYPDLEDKYMKKLQRSFDCLERGETPRPSSRLQHTPRPPSQQRCASATGNRPQSPCRPQSARPQSSRTYQYNNSANRPRSTMEHRGARPRYPLRLPTPKEYICESSFFMNSQLPYHREFIINPEWVSEVKTRKRQAREVRQAKQAFQPAKTCHCTCATCT